MIEKGDVVEVTGKLKQVVDFLKTADKETLRILASFFEGEAKGTVDAKKFKGAIMVTNVYKGAIEVALSKGYVWEDKEDYFKKVYNN